MQRAGFFGLLIGLFFIGCHSNQDQLPFEERFDRYAEKHAMSDHFFIARSYPEAPSLTKYKQALESIKRPNFFRTAPAGFDAPWTNQGPGSLGARINRIAVAATDPDIIYIGYSAGGMFKTIDGGSNWFPVFEDFTYLSIADIVLDANDPDIVYVSTGDPNISGYPFIGDGVYKSTDGGTTWQHLGLGDKGIISKILVHPTNDQIIVAASMGIPFERGPSRGIFRTIDGGTNWQKVHHITDSTGVIDLVMHPSNPDLMLAAGWDRVRNNQESIASGPNAKIYRSLDGGVTWTHLTNGLPTGDLSRTALTATGIPSIFYAQTASANHQFEGIYKTTDSGDTWTKVVNPGQGGLPTGVLSGMGWFFGKFRVDPTNSNRIFVLGLRTYRSNNGGNNWSLITGTGSGSPHVDHHDVAFDSNGDILLATDGGLYKQTFGSIDWIDLENLPMTQIYRTGYNPHQPDTYYGGAQDNGTSRGNVSEQANWEEILGADGFKMVFNANNPNRFYAETQFGNIYMTSNGGAGFLLATNGISGTDRRFWDMPYEISTINPNTLYAGTYRIYQTTNDGVPSWSPISPSLTDPVTLAERFHVITTIHPSPIDSLRVYVGTSDGNAWQTLDGGQSWENINSNLPDRFMSSVKASPTDSTTIFMAQSGYRDGDNTPYLFKSTDNGQSWQTISGNMPDIAINDIWILRNNNDQVIFAATDGGVYATLNGGLTWDRLGGNMPIIPVYSIVHNEENNQVVAGTFARAVQTFDLDSIGVSLDPPPAPATVDLGGRVLTENDLSVSEVQVELQGSYGGQDTTLADGLFAFDAVPVDSLCQLMLEKDINHGNGVSTFDVIMARRHILFIDTLPKPYKWIAADVNRSGSISTFDIVQMTKVILSIDTIFPSNTSWRFVPENFTFSDNPFNDIIPEVYDCGSIEVGQPDQNFIGIKVGDLNDSANPTLLLQGEQRKKRDCIISHQRTSTLEDESWRVDVYADNLSSILGFQGTFKLETPHTFDEIQPGQIELSNEHYTLQQMHQGLLSIAWSVALPIDLAPSRPLFSIVLKGPEIPALALVKFPTKGEVVDGTMEVYDPVLKSKVKETANVKLQAFPNPFNERVVVNIDRLSQPTKWRLFSLSGQVLTSGVVAVDETLILDKAQFGPTGVYLLQIDGVGVEQLLYNP